MGSIISAQVYTLVDQAGNPHTEAWLIWEFRDTTYSAGGENIDLTPYFRRVEQIVANPVSGALNYVPKPNDSDIPGVAGSSRIQLWAPTVSGAGVSIASGTQGFVSGQLISGNISGQVFFALFSGRLAGQGAFAEVAAGTALSGTRARLLVLGY